MTLDRSGNFFESTSSQYGIPQLKFNGGWGKGVLSVSVWDDNGYLVAYRQYRFTVGLKPKQSYPKTWDFGRYFDNSTVKIEESPVTPTESTIALNTRERLKGNNAYVETTRETDPTRTWDDGNVLKRNSGSQSYQKYGFNEYSSYYVDGAVLVCNTGYRNSDGFVLEETRGLGFDISRTGGKLKWVMPNESKGNSDAAYINFAGTITIPNVNDAEHYDDYYLFIRSNRKPDDITNLTTIDSGDDYSGITDESKGQYVYRVSANADMTVTFTSDTNIYGMAVTNIKKDRVTPVGSYAWATESRKVDIDHTQAGYFTKHTMKTYEVKYADYDLNTATVSLSEIRNATTVANEKYYVPSRNGIVLREDINEGSGNTPFAMPLFVPAVTTTRAANISDGNMMRPNLDAKTFNNTELDDDGKAIFLLTNVHWTFSRGGNLDNEEASGKAQPADAAGFYRLHNFQSTTAYSAEALALMNTLRANTAYLAVDNDKLPIAVWNSSTGSSGAPRMNTIAIRNLGGNGETTGIEEIETAQGVTSRQWLEGQWYSLNGMPINKPTKAGIYLLNGRKVVVK